MPKAISHSLINKKILKKLYINHDLSIYTIAKIIPCYPSTIADYLHKFNIPIKPQQEKINITQKELESLYIKNGLSTYKIARIFNCNVHTIQKKMDKFGIKRRPLKKVYISKMELQKLYLKNKLSLKKIGNLYDLCPASVLKKMRIYKIPLRDTWKYKYPKLPFSGNSTEKAYLIGFRLGDLGVRLSSIRTRNVLVGSNTTKIVQINLMKGMFKKYSHVWIGKNINEVYNFSTILHPTFKFLLPKNDRVYSWIKNNKKDMPSFVSGYIDAEGNIGVYAKRARFRVGSYDIGILKEIDKWLKQNNIKSILKIESLKGTVVNSVPLRKDFWRITVNEKSSLLKLFDLLEPYMKHKKRKNDMIKARKNIIFRTIRAKMVKFRHEQKNLHNHTYLLR